MTPDETGPEPLTRGEALVAAHRVMLTLAEFLCHVDIGVSVAVTGVGNQPVTAAEVAANVIQGYLAVADRYLAVAEMVNPIKR